MVETLSEIRSLGVRVGLAVNPDTPVSVLQPYMEQVDMILVMTVQPGFGGQSFIEGSIQRLQAVRAMVQELGCTDLWIEADGGIGPGNIESVKAAGANVLVAGSAVFRGNPAENVNRLKALLEV